MTERQDERILDTPDDPVDDDDSGTSTDRPNGWAGVDEALGGTQNRPAGPDYGAGDTETDITGSEAPDTGSPREDDL